MRDAGERMLAAERELSQGSDPAGAGMRLGEAIADWSELGGYELEGQWDVACRRIVRAGLDEVGPRPATALSGGERKRLVLEGLFQGDAQVLLLDEPDNFLDVPAKLELEARIAASKKTILMISHDRDLLGAATNAIFTLEAHGMWLHGGSYSDLPGGAGAPAGAARRPARAVEARGAAPVPFLQDDEAAGPDLLGAGQPRGRRRDALASLRRRRAAARHPSAANRSSYACPAATPRGSSSPYATSASTGSCGRSRTRSISASASASSAPTARARPISSACWPAR